MFQLLDICSERNTTHDVQKLCCPANYRDDGSVDYKYGLTKGICTVSSVKEILKEKGFPQTALK
jgi:ribonuclease PH